MVSITSCGASGSIFFITRAIFSSSCIKLSLFCKRPAVSAISQVNLFNQCVGLTGITLSKLDGTAKGGVIFAVADKFNIPIRYIGVGEGIDDLRAFKSDDFIDALFSQDEDDA